MLGPSLVRNLLLVFIFAASACARKPDRVETLQLPDGFALTMERSIPSRPLIELVPASDPAMPTESVFIHHHTWKAREGVPLIWDDLKAGCRLYQSATTMALTTKREIAWRVQGVDVFYWSKWQLALNNLPQDHETNLRTALYSLGHLPYEITSFDAAERRCVLRLTHPAYSLPARLTFRFHPVATARNGANIAGGTFVFEEASSK